MDSSLLGTFEGVRAELSTYLCRLVVRPQVADDLVQTTYLRCHEALERLPQTPEGLRAWIFKVATNLALDELRKHSTWRESTLLDLREAVEADSSMVAASVKLVSSPETKAIAREHLVACLACTLRNLPERKAAALLLKEVHGFSPDEAADILHATAVQVKNWLQEARRFMTERYGSTCALVAKNGMCHQCVELDGFFAANQGTPLGRDTSVDARLKIASELRELPLGPWHRMIFALVDQLG
jgi:RNA polymerase sigma-70 factor, ECF subfamily